MKYYFVAFYTQTKKFGWGFAHRFHNQDSPFFDPVKAVRTLLEEDGSNYGKAVVVFYKEISKEHIDYIDKKYGGENETEGSIS